MPTRDINSNSARPSVWSVRLSHSGIASIRLTCRHTLFSMVANNFSFRVTKHLCKILTGRPLRGRYTCGISRFSVGTVSATIKGLTDVSSFVRPLPWNLCQWTQRPRSRRRWHGDKYISSPCEKTPPCDIYCWGVTSIIAWNLLLLLCAQLTRDLLTIAKFLVAAFR